jgi:hypothetical protein
MLKRAIQVAYLSDDLIIYTKWLYTLTQLRISILCRLFRNVHLFIDTWSQQFILFLITGCFQLYVGF